MLHMQISKENALQSPIPQFSHDPNFIAFRSWTTILSLEGTLPEENPSDSKVVFLSGNEKECEVERFPIQEPVCLRNPTRFAHLNITIVCARSGHEVFFARELPAGRFLHLEFLREESYTLHYSPAFSPVTLHRQIKTFTLSPPVRPIPRNFHACFKPIG